METSDGYPMQERKATVVEPKADARVVPFSQMNKPEILEKIFSGEIDISTAEAYKAAKLTNQEKGLLMRDERYLAMLDAKLLDFERGARPIKKLDLQLLKMIYERLNLLQKNITINNRTLKVDRILIQKRESPVDEALRLQREGRAAFPPNEDKGQIGGLRAS